MLRTGGSDLTVSRLTVRNAPQQGLAIEIPAGATGIKKFALLDVRALGNLAGIAVREDDDGSLSATIGRSTTDGNIGLGIDFDENSVGDLTATVRSSSSSSNGGAGVRADQQLAGVGTLSLVAVTLTGNTGGPVVSNPGVTVTQTP